MKGRRQGETGAWRAKIRGFCCLAEGAVLLTTASECAETGDSTICKDHICAENATCVEPTDRSKGRACNCSSGFDDLKCYKAPELNACHSNPCGLFGHCKSHKNGSYHCQCNDGRKLINQYCFEVTKKCALIDPEAVCTNNSICVRFNNTYMCSCQYGLADRRCYRTTPCLSNPCGEGATCVERIDKYECHCADGTTKSRRCTEGIVAYQLKLNNIIAM
ncbi:hypothetical protein M514_23035 [Trichuris suis]|uniref:EGF-like domain-containing protein n=1 Tax=Trichuris suis TaxID=68888 RepID=A0A085N5S7_9BILA|nr:hypothetical protein M514_23035 [Trichuris suis]